MGVFLKYIGIGGAIALVTFLLIIFQKKPEPQPETYLETEFPSKLLETPFPSNGVRQKESKVIPPPAPQVLPKIEVPSEEPAATSTITTEVPSPVPSSLPILPPLDEAAILRAVVKIQCPIADGLGKYIGSGFVLKGGMVVTAGHLVMDSGSETCEVIFSKEKRPIHYLRGAIDNLKEVKRRHDEEGIDAAVLKLPALDSYPEGRAIFETYPFIPYPICENQEMLGDDLLHFGYPSNYADQNYLSRLEGKAIVYGDIKGIKDQLSEDQTFSYKTPIFSFNNDQSKLHPYMVSRVASFYGDSGGPAFNATKQCILGPHRGGTMGKTSGENYSIFMVLGWEGTKQIIGR